MSLTIGVVIKSNQAAEHFFGNPEKSGFYYMFFKVKLVKECSGSDGQSVSSRDSPAPSPVPNSDGFSADTGLLPPSTIPPKPG